MRHVRPRRTRPISLVRPITCQQVLLLEIRCCKYYQVLSRVIKCFHMLSRGIKCYQVLSSVIKCYQVVSSVITCYQVLQVYLFQSRFIFPLRSSSSSSLLNELQISFTNPLIFNLFGRVCICFNLDSYFLCDHHHHHHH